MSKVAFCVAVVLAITLGVGSGVIAPSAVAPRSAFAQNPCTPPILNPIVCENSLPGNPSSQWSVNGTGDPTIAGFTTNMSSNLGDTVNFKINPTATAYTINIYRMGYYGGMGARLVASILPSVSLPQAQPACLTDSTTFLYDCGNWAVSASWPIPTTATSGIYFARLTR